MKKTLLILTIFTIGLNSCGLKEKREKAKEEADVIKSTLIEVGQQVPEFDYITLTNDTINVNDLKGKVVFMNFFATSCPICIKELPFVESDIWAKYKNNENFELIVFGREHVADEVIAFKEKTGYTFNVVPDPGRKIYSLFAERYIPRNVVLDREGKIIYQATGFDDEEFSKLKQVIETELNK
jgi:peroxiredoxin